MVPTAAPDSAATAAGAEADDGGAAPTVFTVSFELIPPLVSPNPDPDPDPGPDAGGVGRLRNEFGLLDGVASTVDVGVPAIGAMLMLRDPMSLAAGSNWMSVGTTTPGLPP